MHFRFFLPFLLVPLAATLQAMPASAAIVEEIVSVPVTIKDVDGATIKQDIVVTIFRDDAKVKGPFLVLNHGRAVDAQARKDFGRSVYKKQSTYFVERGFVVLLPTRIGYGKTGGEDVEDSGSCVQKDYLRSVAPAAEQIRAVVAYARQKSYVDANKGLILGQSVGGLSTIGAAAQNIPGIRAAVNFAGGAGGNPTRTPGHPCRPDVMGETYAKFGSTARVPTLWLYSENDLYWGTEHPKTWFQQFKASGGKGEFVSLPPFGSDGHASFGGNMDVWKEPVEAFLRKAGF